MFAPFTFHNYVSGLWRHATLAYGLEVEGLGHNPRAHETSVRMPCRRAYDVHVSSFSVIFVFFLDFICLSLYLCILYFSVS